MSILHQMAAFVHRAAYGDMSWRAVEQAKIRIMDSFGTAIGAIDGPVSRILREHITDFSRTGASGLIGGGSTAPDLAALYNGALVRYLDFNDSYLAKGETCHPSDNLCSILAAGQYADIDGKTLITALAVAYQVHCRLSDEAPVRNKGFDHTTQGAYAVSAGVAKALGLDSKHITNAIAVSATPLNALRVTRTGALSHWKGLAYPFTSFGATSATFLAMRGITGPAAIFEGNKGFQDSIAGKFEINWDEEDLERITRTIIKKFNAEIHSQTTLEGALELKQKHKFDPADIDRVDIDTFDVAFNIIGGGEEGDKTLVRTKEAADHSLQYMVAAALLDNQVLPEQYQQERIEKEDIQKLLKKIHVRPKDDYSKRFPGAMPSRLTIKLSNGKTFSIEKDDYEGFFTRPMNWDAVFTKFEKLAMPFTTPDLRKKIGETVYSLEKYRVADLMNLLSQVNYETG